MSLTTIIGRGHGGTRAISHTLYASGVYMGQTLNASGDLVPPEAMYEACRIFARHVVRVGELEWDFSRVLAGEIPAEFIELIERYLAAVLANGSAHRGWKIPETTLCYPWIARMYPQANYIHWVRDPRDAILATHKTDDLADFGIDYPATSDIHRRRAISWLYQYQLMQATPRPARCLEVRFEDFVLNQNETLQRLEDFLGIPLARIVVRPDAVGRWRTVPGWTSARDLLEPALHAYGYEPQTMA